MLIKFILLSCFLWLSSCDDPASSSEDLMQKLYVCDEGSDRVIILDATSDNLSQIKAIDINFTSDNDDSETPHYIAIDQSSGYWFVTVKGSGFVGMFDLNTDTLIDTFNLGPMSMPAFIGVDKNKKNIFVSRGAMMGGDDYLYVLDYSGGLLVDAGLVDFTAVVPSFSQVHALSVDYPTIRGTSLVSASYSQDLFAVMSLENDVFTPSIYPLELDNDGGAESNRIRPLTVTQKDDFIFFSCHGNNSNNIPGHIQSWSLTTVDQLDTLQLSFSSKPWHITPSPNSNEIFTVLKGTQGMLGEDDVYSEAGLSCLSYDENGNLTEKWRNTSSDFNMLHGIAISSDGSRAYVSSMGNGSVLVFDTSSGDLLNTIDGLGMYNQDSEQSGKTLSGLAITQ
tara:strand:- start:2504 stop:3685 length:1182 start_codon:yes stop_codon:yes gene_type:complete